MIVYESEIPRYPNDPRLPVELEKHVRAYLSMRASKSNDPDEFADQVVITHTEHDGHRYVHGELDEEARP